MSMTINDLATFFSSLESEEKRNYELDITNFTAKHLDKEMNDELESIVFSDYPDNVRYAAFYSLNILYRRLRNYILLKKLFDRVGEEFKDHITYNHLYALYCMDSKSMYDYDEMMEMTYADALNFNDNAGFVHLFADFFATTMESGDISERNQFKDYWWPKAKSAVDRAIELDPDYAKYYCTKARILAINKDYSSAEQFINMAEAYENSYRTDYAIRLNLYQYYKIMIGIEKKIYGKDEGFSVKQRQTIAKKYGLIDNFDKDKPYFFISYAHFDSDHVFQIISMLQHRGIRVWVDQNNIRGNSDFSEEIANAIQNCDSFVFMVSNTSVLKEYVRKEVKFAINNNKQPLCVFLENTELTPGMKLDLDPYQQLFADYEDLEETVDRIVKKVKVKE